MIAENLLHEICEGLKMRGHRDLGGSYIYRLIEIDNEHHKIWVENDVVKACSLGEIGISGYRQGGKSTLADEIEYWADFEAKLDGAIICFADTLDIAYKYLCQKCYKGLDDDKNGDIQRA